MERYLQFNSAGGTQIDYALILPDGYTPGKEYPLLLALPPGPQNSEMVEAGLGGYWEDQARKRGWIVVSPIAPQSVLFFQGSEKYMPEFLDFLEQTYRLENGRFHLAGVSNGGISAFRIALQDPSRIQSIVVAPGMPANASDFAGLPDLLNIPLAMFVGEDDREWVEPMRETEAALQRLGGTVSLEEEAGQGHYIRSLNGGERLYDFLDGQR